MGRHLAWLTAALCLGSCHLDMYLSGQGYACETKEHCPDGQRCVEGACRFGDADDAGANDTGLADATAADRAIADAAQADAAQADAAQADAAQADAAPTGCDAGSLDADGYDTLMFATETNPQYLVHEQGFLYWTSHSNRGDVRRAATCGGSPVTLASAPTGKPYAIAVDAQHVYFSTDVSSGATDEIYQVAKETFTATPFVVAEDQNTVGSAIGGYDHANTLFSDGSSVYWITMSVANNWNIRRHELSAGEREVVTASSDSSYPRGLVQHGGTAYVVEYNGDISSVPLGFSDLAVSTPVGSIGHKAFAAAANSDTIFWSVDATITPSAAGQIYAFTPTDGLAVGLVESVDPSDAARSVWAMVADDAELYYTTDAPVSGAGSVFRLVLSETEPVRIHSGGEPAGIDMDVDFVYWTDFANGAIHRRPR